MKSNIIFYGFVVGWVFSVIFCLFLSIENIFLRSDLKAEKLGHAEISQIILSLKNSNSPAKKDWDIFGLDDMEYYRSQGKVDGKIEAMLLMANTDIKLDRNQIDKVIELAEKSTALDSNNQFLSLLCQAAYHKGLSQGQDEVQKANEDGYTNGYHKAMEDFSCPETGKMIVPEKKDFDLKKPK